MRGVHRERGVYTTESRVAPVLASAALLALAGCSSDPPRTLAPEPPMLLAAEPGCSLFVGGVSGNDEMSVRLVLCPSPTGVAGTIQYVSSISGWSVRRVAGGVDPNGSLVLADTLMVEMHPSPEWAQCLVDRYELHMSRDGVVDGEYSSAACRDHARVALERSVQ